SINPRHRSFYRKLWGFVPLGPWRAYPQVQNHPAEAYLLDVPLLKANAPEMFRQIFGEWLPRDMLKAPRMPTALVHYFSSHSSQLVDYGQADIWIGHRHMNNVDIGTFIPERWIQRIRAVEGVERAEPYLVMFSQATMADGHFENVVVIGCEAASLLGNAWKMAN